jgi:hypothetical protein
MKQKFLLIGLVFAASLLILSGVSRAARPQLVQEPILKWSEAGCHLSWCETGWYASPAVADIDGDGAMEVLAGAYTLFVLNGETGAVENSVDTPGGRIWPGVVVADIDGDGDDEIIIAQSGGYLYVFDGALNTVWVQHPIEQELRGLSVADLDADGTLEIIVPPGRKS